MGDSKQGVLTGVQLIAQERARQVAEEGWSLKHDDKHSAAELAFAAVSYTLHSAEKTAGWWKTRKYVPARWPWEKKWWKPSNDPIRNLVKAGALIAAEIDRLQRAEREVGG